VSSVSVVVPVYRDGSFLLDSLENILSSNSLSEVVLVVDEPTPTFLKKLNSLKNFPKLKIVVNSTRNGKVSALNEGVKLTRGNILLFLDSDVSIPENGFVDKLVKEMDGYDIVDIKKEIVPEGFLGKMMYYDYLSFNIASWLFCRLLKRLPAINGAAFAVKRRGFDEVGFFNRVVSEDLDWGFRAFRRKLRVKYAYNICVKVKPITSWRKWFEQRKRWAFGFSEWFVKNFKEILATLIRYPFIVIPCSIMALPSISIILLDFLVNDEIVLKMLSIFFITTVTKIGLPFLPIAVSVNIALALKEALILTASFTVSSAATGVIAKKLGYKFKLHEYAVYYFTYSLAWLMILLSALLCYTVTRKIPKLDWKV